MSPQQCTLLHEDNREEKTPSCPKQTNKIDCGVYTWSFAKQNLAGCNSPMAFDGSDFQNEMVGDLLEPPASNKCSGDFRWLSGDATSKQKNAEEMSEKEKLNVEVQSAGLQTATLLLLEMVTAYSTELVTNSHASVQPSRPHRSCV